MPARIDIKRQTLKKKPKSWSIDDETYDAFFGLVDKRKTTISKEINNFICSELRKSILDGTYINLFKKEPTSDLLYVLDLKEKEGERGKYEKL